MKTLRITSLVLALFLLVGVFAGCGASKKNVATTGDKNEPYEMQWYFIGNPAGKNDIATVEAEINKYTKEKLNLTVKMTSLDWGTYETKANMMLAGGESLDLVFTAASTLSYRLNVAKGAFLPVNDLLDKYAPKTKELLGEAFLKGSEVDGVNYAIPANKDKAHNWGFVYRKDLVEKYNVDITKYNSFEDLAPLLKVIKEKEPGVMPLGVAGSRTPAFALDFDMISAPGGFFPDSDSDKVVNFYATKEYEQALRTARKYYQAGYVRQDSGVAKDYSALQRAGTFFVTMETCKPGKADELASNSQYKFLQHDITPPRTMIGDAMGSMLAIPRSSKNPARVMQFVNLMYTDVYLNNLIVNGVEGKHYTKKEGNYIEPIKDSGYTQAGYQWMFGNVFINYLLPGEKADKFVKIEEFNKIAKPSKRLGFASDVEPVRTESAAIENVKTEFIMPLETGSVDVDEYLPKFLDKLKQAGAEKVITELQKQYDAFLKK